MDGTPLLRIYEAVARRLNGGMGLGLPQYRRLPCSFGSGRGRREIDKDSTAGFLHFPATFSACGSTRQLTSVGHAITFSRLEQMRLSR